jgi:hypothetical protein
MTIDDYTQGPGIERPAINAGIDLIATGQHGELAAELALTTKRSPARRSRWGAAPPPHAVTAAVALRGVRGHST